MNKGWKKVKVGEIFDVQLGKMLSPKAKEGEQYTYLGNFNVQWGSINFKKLNTMHFSDREKEKYLLKENDILMCEGGEIGRCAIWRNQYENCFYQKALHRLRALKPNIVNPYYFYTYMQYITSNNGLVKIVGETSIAHLTREKLRELKFPLPSIKDQNQISDIFKEWDNAIEKTEALIAAKEKQFEWLISELISKPNEEKKDNWRQVKLGDIGEISSAGVDKKIIKGEIPVRLINYLDVYRSDFIDSKNITHQVTAPAAKASKCAIQKGDVFFTPSSELRGDIGHSSVATEDMPDAVYSYHVVRLRLHENWDLKYRAYAFKARNFFKQAYKYADGSGQRYVISQNNFRKMEILVPPLETQQKISNILSEAQKEILLLKKTLGKYRSQKRGLMQKLLTGEWQVTSAQVGAEGELQDRTKENVA
jgi:type I restriction enzyme S subunit|tara:strand:+ start:14 stop:1279 length:1266 start_codon:yes stop_codon:yes gene_type:complete